MCRPEAGVGHGRGEGKIRGARVEDSDCFRMLRRLDDSIDGTELSVLGVDGILISWLDYLGECRQWIDDVLPLMEQAGQRAPNKASDNL